MVIKQRRTDKPLAKAKPLASLMIVSPLDLYRPLCVALSLGTLKLEAEKPREAALCLLTLGHPGPSAKNLSPCSFHKSCKKTNLDCQKAPGLAGPIVP